MALTRKRQKELNRLKSEAEDLWENQKELLEHATKVVRAASRQAAYGVTARRSGPRTGLIVGPTGR